MVLPDVATTVGYYRRPSCGEWMARTRTPNGFAPHSAFEQLRGPSGCRV